LLASGEQALYGTEDGLVSNTREGGNLLAPYEEVSSRLCSSNCSIEMPLPRYRPAVLEIPSIDVIEGIVPVVRIPLSEPDRDYPVALPQKDDIARLNALLEVAHAARVRGRDLPSAAHFL
jgi:hypothetical protein